jgi:hypothetical protein
MSKKKRIHCKGIEPLAEAIDLPFGNQTVFGKLLCYHYTNSVFHIRFCEKCQYRMHRPPVSESITDQSI